MKGLFQHLAISMGVTVRVAVNFLPEQSRVAAGSWFWVYHIRIENDSRRTLQLLTRHWRITDAHGVVSIVEGEGVVGEQPVLRPGGTHDYVSGCPLGTPRGVMEGHYTFRCEDDADAREADADDWAITGPRGTLVRIAIPRFPLAAPATAS